LKAILEALIFASPDPLTPKAMSNCSNTEPKEDVQAALAELRQDYERPGGLQLVEVRGGIRSSRAPIFTSGSGAVSRAHHRSSRCRRSRHSRHRVSEPITAIEITRVRGVNTSGVLNTLLERHRDQVVGRKPVVGRPFLYARRKSS